MSSGNIDDKFGAGEGRDFCNSFVKFGTGGGLGWWICFFTFGAGGGRGCCKYFVKLGAGGGLGWLIFFFEFGSGG